jgi:hypothetical protein
MGLTSSADFNQACGTLFGYGCAFPGVNPTEFRCAAECAVHFEPLCANASFFRYFNKVLPSGLGWGQVIDFIR